MIKVRSDAVLVNELRVRIEQFGPDEVCLVHVGSLVGWLTWPGVQRIWKSVAKTIKAVYRKA